MPTLWKKPSRRKWRASDVDRLVRMSRPRDGAVRAVDAPKKPKKPAAPTPPRVPFDGERQTFVCLYLNLITSEHPEADIALEFWRCYKHLLEGGTPESMPVRLINRQLFLDELARVKAQKAYLLDDPNTTANREGEKEKHDREQPRPRRTR